jgi:hypothetical protein
MNGTGDGGQEVVQKIPVLEESLPEETRKETIEESPQKEPSQNSVRFGLQESSSKSSDYEPKKQTLRSRSSQRPMSMSSLTLFQSSLSDSKRWQSSFGSLTLTESSWQSSTRSLTLGLQNPVSQESSKSIDQTNEEPSGDPP